MKHFRCDLCFKEFIKTGIVRDYIWDVCSYIPCEHIKKDIRNTKSPKYTGTIPEN